MKPTFSYSYVFTYRTLPIIVISFFLYQLAQNANYVYTSIVTFIFNAVVVFLWKTFPSVSSTPSSCLSPFILIVRVTSEYPSGSSKEDQNNFKLYFLVIPYVYSKSVRLYILESSSFMAIPQMAASNCNSKTVDAIQFGRPNRLVKLTSDMDGPMFYFLCKQVS